MLCLVNLGRPVEALQEFQGSGENAYFGKIKAISALIPALASYDFLTWNFERAANEVVIVVADIPVTC
jgi:hypothetical protein